MPSAFTDHTEHNNLCSNALLSFIIVTLYEQSATATSTSKLVVYYRHTLRAIGNSNIKTPLHASNYPLKCLFCPATIATQKTCTISRNTSHNIDEINTSQAGESLPNIPQRMKDIGSNFLIIVFFVVRFIINFLLVVFFVVPFQGLDYLSDLPF